MKKWSVRVVVGLFPAVYALRSGKMSEAEMVKCMSSSKKKNYTPTFDQAKTDLDIAVRDTFKKFRKLPVSNLILKVTFYDIQTLN